MKEGASLYVEKLEDGCPKTDALSTSPPIPSTYIYFEGPSGDIEYTDTDFNKIICAGSVNASGIGQPYISSFTANLDDNVVTFTWETLFPDENDLTLKSIEIEGGENELNPSDYTAYSSLTTNTYTGDPHTGTVTYTDTDNNITDPDNHFYKLTMTIDNDIERSGTDACGCSYTINSGTDLTDYSITPLPVEMAYFTASRQGGDILLTWSTTSEENNDFFEVQRSIDGKNYTSITEPIKGRGEGTLNGQDYRYTDIQAPKGLVYYRLKQVDIGGKFEYYNMVVNPSASQRTFSVDNYSGNPLKDKDLELQLYNPITQQLYMVLVNTQGMVTYERRITLKGGYTRLRIPEEQVSQGMSVLKIISANKQESIKLIKY
ncbi:hypothetical protein [Algivirga pacifica]|uniref:hypothetical protein n=1 Tax=Algivirga pacifica TaxID=1162670 RepID=UPI0031F096FA